MPEKIDSLDTSTFLNCKGLKDVVLPKELKYIGKYAFSGCSSLKEIALPQNLKIIDERAFYGCTSLHTINIPSSVKEIRNYAFYGCSSVETIIFNSHFKDGLSTFDGCNKKLNAVYSYTASPSLIPMGLGGGMSDDCKLYIPKGTREIYECRERYWCHSFKTVIEMEDHEVKLFSAENADGTVIWYEVVDENEKTCRVNSMGFHREMIDVPEYADGYKVIDIDFWGFRKRANYGYSLNKIIMPKTIEHISSYASAFSGIEEIYMNRATPPAIDEDAFHEETYSNAKLYIPVGSIKKYQSSEGWNDFKNILEGIPSDIEQITIDSASENVVVYSLSGQRLSAPRKGINIINGKKVIVK